MNRYQFEDLISSYLENELSFSKRKEFENYMRDHPDSENLVSQIDANIARFKKMPKLKVRSSFNQLLDKKVEKIKKDPKSREITNLIFGLTPINASFLFGLVVVSIIIGLQLINPKSGYQQAGRSNLVEEQPKDSNSSSRNINNSTQSNFVDIKNDSTEIELQKQRKKDYSNKIQFVND